MSRKIKLGTVCSKSYQQLYTSWTGIPSGMTMPIPLLSLLIL